MSAPRPDDPTLLQPYPGGQDDPAYRWAFNAWAVLFLGVLCLGLLNYLGQYLKHYWPWL